MALNIQEINGTDGLPQSRQLINNNFSVLKNSLQALLNIVNTDNGNITGVSALAVSNSAVNILTNILSIGNSASIAGSLSIGTANNTTAVTVLGTGGVSIVSGSLTVGAGDVTLSNSSSTLSVGGKIVLNGQVNKPGISNAFSNNIDATTNATIDVTGRKYIVVTNSTTSAATSALVNGSAGQVLDIILYNTVATNAAVVISGVKTIGETNTNNVSLSKSGDSIRVVFEGNTWYLLGATSTSQLTGGNSIVLS